MPEDTGSLASSALPDQDADGALDQMLTVAEVAMWLKVSRSWVYERARARGLDRLPHVKLGKYLRFNPRDLRAYIDAKRESSHRAPRPR